MPGSVIYLSPAVKNKTNDIKFGRTATVKAGSSGTTSYVINIFIFILEKITDFKSTTYAILIVKLEAVKKSIHYCASNVCVDTYCFHRLVG